VKAFVYITLAFALCLAAPALAQNYYNADAPSPDNPAAAPPAAETPAAPAPAAAAPAPAENPVQEIDAPPTLDEAYEAQAPAGGHTVVVTSLKKCYTQLGREEALEIETKYTKPYEECQKRLAAKVKRDQQLKAGQQPKDSKDATNKEGAAPDAAPADSGFYRVQKDAVPSSWQSTPAVPPSQMKSNPSDYSGLNK
jgi:hypothetical protein